MCQMCDQVRELRRLSDEKDLSAEELMDRLQSLKNPIASVIVTLATRAKVNEAYSLYQVLTTWVMLYDYNSAEGREHIPLMDSLHDKLSDQMEEENEALLC
jgi:hypothetical protein